MTEGFRLQTQESTLLIKNKNGSIGTGFFITSNGILLTCNHVIGDSEECTILWNDMEYVGKIIEKTNSEFPDFTLIQIEYAGTTPFLRIGTYKLLPLDKVYTCGYTQNNNNLDSRTLEIEGDTILSIYKQKLIRFKNSNIVPGMSGSPVICEKEKVVCGYIKQTLDSKSLMGGRMVPFTEDFHKNVFAINIKSHGIKNYEILGERLKKYESAICSQYITGSNKIKINDLLRSDFKVSFTSNNQDNLLNYLLENVNSQIKLLLLADPGLGKSTFGYSLFISLLDKVNIENDVCIIPVHIDLRDHLNTVDFGTDEWIKKNITGLGVDKSNKNITYFYILDSLDEFLSNCTKSEIKRKLKLEIFNVSNVITCRAHYYSRYLSQSDIARSFDKETLTHWNGDYKQSYTEWYLRKINIHNKISTKEIIKGIESSRYINELCKVPLRYNMTLETLADSNLNLDLVQNIERLYYNYIYTWLQREESRNDNLIESEDKYTLLECVAWNFYDERQIGVNSEKIHFTTVELQDFLKENDIIKRKYGNIEISELADDLIYRSILTPIVHSHPLNIRFSHKSFHEFFVASFINSTLMKKDKIEEVTEIFRVFIPQEVEQFFKEYIHKSNDDVRKLSIISEKLTNAFKKNMKDKNDSAELSSKKRIAIEQLSYNMGHYKENSVLNFLENQLRFEKDEFIKRSMIIGLAFGGKNEHIDQYVLELREEVINNRNERNIVNIGAQLTYFGDQPFEAVNPEKDYGLEYCQNTIKKLISQFANSQNNQGSWKLDLYTILYLSKHRTLSINDFNIAFQENIDDFKSFITKIKEIPLYKDWLEIKEAEELILKY